MMKNFVIPNLSTPDPESLSEYLISSTSAFTEITGVPVTYFNGNNDIVREFGQEEKICNIFKVYHNPSSPCRNKLSSSGQFVSRLGEPYIFLCKAGLANIAMSLIIDEVFAGYFIAGPIVMGELRNSTTDRFLSLNNLDDTSLSMAKMFVNKMRNYEPNQISQLALLFYNCIITSVSGNNDYSPLRNQYSEQNQINTNIQQYKKENITIEYPYDLEKVLIANINDGQTDMAKANIAELLNQFSILESGSLDGIKAKTLWFFAIAIRVADENGSNLSQVLDTDLDIISKLSEADSFGHLLSLSESLIEKITKNMLSSIYSGQSQIVAKALQYINKNYQNKISLKDIENQLYVNTSYFSTLFKNEMGITFTDYLNTLKVEHACDLLTNTNLSIIDISLSSGFEDQSYFTRVFKKIIGKTPKGYRTSHYPSVKK